MSLSKCRLQVGQNYSAQENLLKNGTWGGEWGWGPQWGKTKFDIWITMVVVRIIIVTIMNNSDNSDSEKDDCENNDDHPPPSQHISLSASSPPALFICIIAKSELHCSIVSLQQLQHCMLQHCMSRSLVLSCFSRFIPTCIVHLYYRPIPWKCHVCIAWHWIGIQLSGLCQWPESTDAHHILWRRLLPSQFLNILPPLGLICQHLTFISYYAILHILFLLSLL